MTVKADKPGKSFLEGLGKKLGQLTGKSGAFSSGSTGGISDNLRARIARVAFELRTLNEEREKLLRRLGETLWKAHRNRRLADVEATCQEDLQEMEHPPYLNRACASCGNGAQALF